MSSGSKSEARNPGEASSRTNSKQSPMIEFKMFKTKKFREFEFREFEFVLRQAQDGEQCRTI